MAALRIIGNSVGRRERLDLHFYVAHPWQIAGMAPNDSKAALPEECLLTPEGAERVLADAPIQQFSWMPVPGEIHPARSTFPCNRRNSRPGQVPLRRMP